jgi:hypothetical protein
VTDLHLTSLALRFATDKELKAALQTTDAIIEWPAIGFTFHRSLQTLAIVRTGALGGDVREVHGGWVYMIPGHLLKEWEEINIGGEAYRRTRHGKP